VSTVVITITPPGGSPTDYTNSCVFSRCSFESEFNGAPGTFDVFLRDPTRSLSFVTGSEILLTVDTVTLFGGYVTQVGMTSLAPAADTSNLSTYSLAAWHLSGSDYNIAFDRRLFRNTSDYLSIIQINEVVDGAILRTAIDSYTDMSDFDTSGIDDIATIPDITFVSLQQGWTVRKEFETLLPFSGAVYYIDGDKTIIYKAYDNAEKRWGFSDAPNHNTITASPNEYQGATYGFSSVEGTEDATYMSNDVFIWGGSEFAGSGGTVFHRSQDGTSQTDHGRWQYGETHFGEQWFKTNAGVTAAANAILNGPPGTDATGQQKGLKNAQRQYSFTWYSDQVPLLSGVPDHVRAGDLMTVNLSVFDDTRLLPVRSLRISFPDAFTGNPASDDRLVQFDGTFGLQLSDSFTLWRYVIKNNNRVVIATQQVVTGTGTSTTSNFGANYSGSPLPVPDGSTTVFTTPFPYILGTSQVYLNGLLQRSGEDYYESNNQSGQYTFSSAPLVTDDIFIANFTLSGASSATVPTDNAYYISPAGNDSTGDGSEGNPWASFSKFLAIPPSPGDTLVIRGGTYSGSLNHNLTVTGINGTAGHPITLLGYPGEFITFDLGANGTSDTDNYFIEGYPDFNYWTFQGLNFINGCKDQNGLFTFSGDSGHTWSNIRIIGCNITKVGPQTASPNTSQIIYFGEFGTTALVQNCVIVGTYPTVTTDGAGFTTDHGPPSAKNITSDHNIYYHCNKGIQIYGSDGSPNGVTITSDHDTFIGCGRNVELTHYMTASITNAAGNTAGESPVYNLYDSGSGTLTANNNFWAQTFDSNYLLLPGNTGIKAASDGTDAGARNT
jgi:hypothetical protein